MPLYTNVTVSAKTRIVRTCTDLKKNSQVIALDSRASKKINLYRNHTEKSIGAYICCHNFCLHLPTELGFGLKCSLVIGQSSKLSYSTVVLYNRYHEGVGVATFRLFGSIG